MRKPTRFGKTRVISVVRSLLTPPSTTDGAVPDIARQVVSTTCSGFRAFSGVALIGVAVSPGETAKMRSPVCAVPTRIIEAARNLAASGEPLALNAVARASDVGVGTVYRHFSTVEELEETLVWERFDDLAEALDSAGPAQLEHVLATIFTLLAEDALFEKVTARAEPALEQTAALLSALTDRLTGLLNRTRADGALRDGIDAAGVLMLMCGLAHSARNVGLGTDTPQAQLLLRVIFDGLQAP